MITLAFAQMFFFLFVSLKTYGGEDGIMVRRSNESVWAEHAGQVPRLYWVVLTLPPAILCFCGGW